MAKYSYEFKKQVVSEYLKGESGYRKIGKQFDIPIKNVKLWVKNYQVNGDEGLKRSRQNRNYSLEYKLYVVELYLSSEVSYQDLAAQEKINNPALICRGVNDFRIAGVDALRPKKKGLKKTLNSKDENSIKPIEAKDTSVDTSTEHIKELEDELLKLRIENAYLKELRRLRLEEETLLKKRRELSTVSEENSN